MDNSKQSWMNMISTPGMRRRTFISCFLGLFTQMSGNTLLSYYQNFLFGMMGYTSSYAKTRINLANQCWSLINATVLALIVARFKRRTMFLASTLAMLATFVAMTVSFQRLKLAKAHKSQNQSAAIAALFFFFAYSPAYNLGNNALTYSKFVLQITAEFTLTKTQLILLSFSRILSELAALESSKFLARSAPSFPTM